MKKISIIVIIVLGIQFTAAQTGKIHYDISYESLEEEDDDFVDMFLSSSTMDLFFSGGNTKVNLNVAFMNTSIIYNDEAKEALMLMDMLGMKIATKLDEDDFDEPNANPTKVEITGKTKKIIGYSCKQAFVFGENNEQTEIWFTEELNNFLSANNFQYSYNVNGLPLQIISKENGMLANIIAVSFENKVFENEFSLEVPDGYELKTIEELNEIGSDY